MNVIHKKVQNLLTAGAGISLAICMCACGVAGAGTSNGNTSTQTTENAMGTEIAWSEDTPAWQRYVDEPITLDWYINYSWFATPWGENLVSQTITEETGVSVNFITPMGNEEEKLNSLIASDKLPDIITLGYWETQIDEMIEKDMVYALN